MKSFKLYLILILILFLIIEILSFFLVNIKANNLITKIPKKQFMEFKELKNYVEYLPYVRELSYNLEHKHLILDNNSFIYNIFNDFNDVNNENILIQGDSEAALLNIKKIHSYLKNYARENKLGLLNSAVGSYSISPMTVQLDILEKELNIKPSIIIAIIDQTDIGDELYKYKDTNNKFALNLLESDRIFQLKSIEKLKTFNLSSYKLLQYTLDYYIYKKKRNNISNIGFIKSIFDKVNSAIFDVPEVLYPLKRGISINEKNLFSKRLKNYIDQAFENKNLKKIFFVTHPDKYHLKNEFVTNVSTIVDQIIIESRFKKNLNHINFSKNNKDINIESFRKLDPYSHPTEEAYLNYYLPTLLEKIKLIQN